jgi:phage terminase large subunit-like protein
MVSLTLPSAERLGAQRPRLLHVPDFSSSTGEEACELAAMAGLEMDPWQQFAIHNALGERPDGKWAAFEVGIEVPRQNGKGGILETFGLAGLFLLGEQLIIHSAHEFATAEEALERMSQIIEGCSTFRGVSGRSSTRMARRASI